MAITLKNITLRNFLSIGQVTQAVNFDRQELTLILGENLDLGGDGARNGTGKTSLIQGLSYALFGVPINSIRKDNLVNRTNGKNMLVTLEFSVDGLEYKIERGRKPNLLRFYINNDLQKNTDDAQGENKETQIAIERVIQMSADMFRHIVALNTYSEPFLALKTNDQRDIIEQLLGITLLSEKADIVKNMVRDSKDSIQSEEFRVKAVEEANKRVKEQIDSTKRRSKLWQDKHNLDLTKLTLTYTELTNIDITTELQAHKNLSEYIQKRKDIEDLTKLIARCVTDEAKDLKLITKLKEAAVQALSTNSQYIENTGLLQQLGTLGMLPITHYNTEAEAVKHSSEIANIVTQLENKANEVDPYSEQIIEMERHALQSIDFEVINKLTRTMEHQKFLLDLLTSKDSFVRKKIIDQNLSYLNARLTDYLDKIGLPHQVIFKNDLQVEITELGRELDFDNLSRGERNRLILGLSFAFRDVWENLYKPINTLFIDELIDSGLDTMGVENAIAIFKDMSRRRHKSIWLVSHREELAGRVPSVLKVVKEGGFTSYHNTVDIE